MPHSIADNGQARIIGANYKSVTGTYVSFSGPLQFESQLERDAYLLLDFEPSISKIQTQPLRLGNYTPDCMVITSSNQVLIAEIKYKQELLEKWSVFKTKFQNASRLSAERGALFGFISDEKVYADYNRLDILKWVKFMARNAPSELAFSTFHQIHGLVHNEISLGSLVERMNPSCQNAIQLVCDSISRKRLLVKSTPTRNPLEAVLSTSEYSSNALQLIIPYDELAESMEAE